MSQQPGHVIWTELMTPEPGRAMAFYGRVCGWEGTSVPNPAGPGLYHLAMAGGQPVAGMMDPADAGAGAEGEGPMWLSYFAVDDLEAAVARARDAGGRLEQPPFEVPGTGFVAVLRDPAGALFGLMEPAPMQSVEEGRDTIAEGPDEDENFPV